MGAVTPLIFYPFFPSVSPRADIGKLQLNYINSILGGGSHYLKPHKSFSFAIPLIFVPPWAPHQNILGILFLLL